MTGRSRIGWYNGEKIDMGPDGIMGPDRQNVLPTLDQWNDAKRMTDRTHEPHPLGAVLASVLCPQCGEEMRELPQVFFVAGGATYRNVFCACGFRGRKLM